MAPICLSWAPHRFFSQSSPLRGRGVLEIASSVQRLQFVNFLRHHRFRSWSHPNKCVFATLLMKPNVDKVVLPEKSLCWWCSCISVPGPERPYQPKTGVSPQSHLGLRKTNGYRRRCRMEILSTGLFVPSWNLSVSSVSDLWSLFEATGVSSSWPVDIIFWRRLFSFSKSPKKKKKSQKLKVFAKVAI